MVSCNDGNIELETDSDGNLATRPVVEYDTTEEKTTEETTTEEATTEEVTLDLTLDYPYGTFDFDEMCKNVEINGKKVDFPWTLEKLGEGYTLEQSPHVEQIKLLMYEGEEIAHVMLNSKGEMHYISCDSEKIDLKICGVTRGHTLEEVKKVFGKSESPNESIGRYTNNNNRLSFSGSGTDNLLYLIQLDYGEIE